MRQHGLFDLGSPARALSSPGPAAEVLERAARFPGSRVTGVAEPLVWGIHRELPYTTPLETLALYVLFTGMVLYAGVCGALYLGQGRIVYLAWMIQFKPPVLERAGAQALHIRCGDATIKVWRLHPQRRTALVYFGGSSEDVSVNLADFDTLFADRAVYLVSYRGYTGSTGRPSEARLIADAEAIFDWIAARHERVIVIGKSLGSGVATALAVRRPVEKLILVTPYDTLTNLAADYLPFLPVRWMMRDRYDSVRRITQVRCPVLVVVAEQDGLVLKPRSDALIAAVPEAYRHVRVIQGAAHITIRHFPEYARTLQAFIRS